MFSQRVEVGWLGPEQILLITSLVRLGLLDDSHTLQARQVRA
jgi:hypothetical protein